MKKFVVISFFITSMGAYGMEQPYLSYKNDPINQGKFEERAIKKYAKDEEGLELWKQAVRNTADSIGLRVGEDINDIIYNSDWAVAANISLGFEGWWTEETREKAEQFFASTTISILKKATEKNIDGESLRGLVINLGNIDMYFRKNWDVQ